MLLSSQTRRSSSRAAALSRLAAVTIGQSDTAKARKIAVLFYNAIRHGITYQDQGAAAYDERHRQRLLSNLQRRARTLGDALAPMPEQQTVS